MSIQVVSNEHNAALFCSTTMTAFGHVFSGNERHGLDAGEVAQVFLASLRGPDLRTLEEYQQLDKANTFLMWLEAQEQGPDVDDLERMAKTGEVRCPDCGEWTEPIEADPIKGIRARRRCDDCHDEFLRDQEAERKGDQMRDEGL